MVAVPILLTRPLITQRTMEPTAELADQIRHVLMPLVVEHRTRRLSTYLDSKIEEYQETLELGAHLLLAELPDQEVKDKLKSIVQETYAEVTNLVNTKGEALLRQRERGALLSSMQSRADLATEIMRASDEGRLLELLDPLTASSGNLFKADMCISAVLLVFMGEVSHWEPEQLNRLCLYAERYMLEVEDVFLAYHPELIKRIEAKGETITLKQLEQELGLSD